MFKTWWKILRISNNINFTQTIVFYWKKGNKFLYRNLKIGTTITMNIYSWIDPRYKKRPNNLVIISIISFNKSAYLNNLIFILAAINLLLCKSLKKTVKNGLPYNHKLNKVISNLLVNIFMIKKTSMILETSITTISMEMIVANLILMNMMT